MIPLVLTLLALVGVAVYQEGQRRDRLRNIHRETHRDRYGRCLAFRRPPEDLTELKTLEKTWRIKIKEPNN